MFVVHKEIEILPEYSKDLVCPAGVASNGDTQVPYFFDRVKGQTLTMVQVRNIVTCFGRDARGLELGRSKIHQLSISPESLSFEVLL